MDVTVRRYDEKDENAVLEISLDKSQTEFTVTPERFAQEDSEDSEDIDRYVIIVNGAVSGYFKIDKAYSVGKVDCKPKSIGLRGLALDSRLQGKGIGKLALQVLCLQLPKDYRQYNWLYLTVNCRNLPAYRCYLASGFEDTENLYLGGPVGPQYIMRAKLSDES